MFLWYIFQHSETTLISKSLGEWFLNLYASIFKLQGPVFLWNRKNYFEETSHFCMNIKFHPIQQSISHAVNSLPFVTVSIRARAYIIFSIFPCIDSVWGLRCCTGLGTGYYHLKWFTKMKVTGKFQLGDLLTTPSLPSTIYKFWFFFLKRTKTPILLGS